jgi:D-hexose-6-phosphate mutarotase
MGFAGSAAMLTMALEVENRSATAFVFEEALHTYFTVSDVRRVTVRGALVTARCAGRVHRHRRHGQVLDDGGLRPRPFSVW